MKKELVKELRKKALDVSELFIEECGLVAERRTLRDVTLPNNQCGRAVELFIEELRQEAIKWLKVMNKEDWDNRTYIIDVWKDFFNLTEEDLKGDEKE